MTSDGGTRKKLKEEIKRECIEWGAILTPSVGGTKTLPLAYLERQDVNTCSLAW